MYGQDAVQRERDALLQRTEAVQVSKQDVQEGYDITLLESQPRGSETVSPAGTGATTVRPHEIRGPYSSNTPSSPSASLHTEIIEPSSPLQSDSRANHTTVPTSPALPHAAPQPRRSRLGSASNSPRNAAEMYAARARAAEFAREANLESERRVASWLPFWGRAGHHRASVVYSEVKPNVDDAAEDPEAKDEHARCGEEEPETTTRLCCGVERRVWMWIGALVLACIVLGVGIGVGVGLKSRHAHEPEPASAVRPTMVETPTSAAMPLPPPPRTDQPTVTDIQPSLSQSDLGVPTAPTDQPTTAEVAETFSSFGPDGFTQPAEQPVAADGPGIDGFSNSDWDDPTLPTPTAFPDTQEGAV